MTMTNYYLGWCDGNAKPLIQPIAKEIAENAQRFPGLHHCWRVEAETIAEAREKIAKGEAEALK